MKTAREIGVVIVCLGLLSIPFLPSFPASEPGVPTVALDVQKTYPRDHKIVINVQGIDSVKARVKWWIRSCSGTSPDFVVFNDGKACAVWAPSGNYEVLVTIGVVDANSVEWIDIEHAFAVVEGPTPGPGPGPGPGPTPVPTPDGGFGDVVAEIVKLAGPVRDDDKAEAAKLIADAYRKHGALAAKGEYSDQNLLAEATSSEFVYSLGLTRYLRWRPMQTKVREHMAKLIAEGKLKDKDMKQWAALWEQYAKGFDAVAKGA